MPVWWLSLSNSSASGASGAHTDGHWGVQTWRGGRHAHKVCPQHAHGSCPHLPLRSRPSSSSYYTERRKKLCGLNMHTYTHIIENVFFLGGGLPINHFEEIQHIFTTALRASLKTECGPWGKMSLTPLTWCCCIRPYYYMNITWSRGCYMDTSNPKIDFDSASQSSPLSTFAQCTLHTGNRIHTINNWSGIVLLKSSNQLRPQLNSMLSLLDHGWVSCVGMLINDSDVAVVK